MYFTSDQHYGHKNVIKYCRRPFAVNMDDATVDEILAMNEHIVKVYNETVGPDGHCIHVGDFSLGLNHVDTYGPRLLGQKDFVPGNHDWCHIMHTRKPQKRQKAIERFERVGFRVQTSELMVVNGEHLIKVCHLPYWEENEVEGYEGRFKEFRPQYEGEDFLICGHVHSAWLKKGRMINVGVDVWDFKPVHIDTIIKVAKDERNFIKGQQDLYFR